MAIGQIMARMILLYDQWNKLKSFSILNRQALEHLVLISSFHLRFHLRLAHSYTDRYQRS